VSIGIWADAAGHPPGDALAAAGFTGVFLYVGTPAFPKDATAAVYADYVAHGLKVAGIYELGLDDITSGMGGAHAANAMADLLQIGAPRSTPLGCTADRHLTAAEIPTAVSYQRDFFNECKRAGWAGPIGAYGFAEYTHATHDAGVAEWLWQCGAESALWPGVHFWQRNDVLTQIVGGVEVDINEQYLPMGANAMTPEQETQLREIHEQMFGPWPSWVVPNPDGVAFTLVDYSRAIDRNLFMLAPQVAALTAAVAALSKDPELTADAVRSIVDAAVSAHVEITGTVAIHSTPAPPAGPAGGAV
jgi:hypothetical protein